MRKLIFLCLPLLAACQPNEPTYDKVKQRQIFMECLKALPVPSQQIKYLGDVVDSCNNAARELSEIKS